LSWDGKSRIPFRPTRPGLVLHERKSRVTLAARLAGKTAAETISVMLAIFARIKPALRKSITFDNDTAFAQLGLLQSMRAIATWFCDAYASWQKGGVENANGRLRRWLPRHIDIDRLSDEEIQDIIVITANLTPRKCLGFKTTLPGDPQRAWQRRPNPLLLNQLRFAPELRPTRAPARLFETTPSRPALYRSSGREFTVCREPFTDMIGTVMESSRARRVTLRSGLCALSHGLVHGVAMFGAYPEPFGG
jgi:hypothetical protein